MEPPKYYYNIDQSSDEWHNLRLKIPTASEMKKLLTSKFKRADNVTSRTYTEVKAAERILGKPEPFRSSYDMERGTMQEPLARDYYASVYGEVTECGFITRDFGGFTIGCSPDGLVGEDGGIEIKSRVAKFQIQVIREKKVPDEYMVQIQTFLAVTGRAWCDFVQYSNGMKLFVQRVYPDAELLATILQAAQEFEEKVCELVDSYNENAKGLIPTEWIDLDFNDAGVEE